MSTLLGSIEYSVMVESAMTDDQRAEAGNILPPEWVAGDKEIATRGWVQNEPVYRVLAHTPDGLLVAQGSLVNVTTNQEVYPYDGVGSAPHIYGLAEGVVHEQYRGRRIGATVMEMRVSLAEALGAQLIMAASGVPQVRSTLSRLGFRSAYIGEFFFSRDSCPRCSNPNWLVRGNPPRAPWQIANDF